MDLPTSPIDKDWNGVPGEYSEEEFRRMVIEHRKRWCQNDLATYPNPMTARYFGNKRVVHLPNGRVRLEEL